MNGHVTARASEITMELTKAALTPDRLKPAKSQASNKRSTVCVRATAIAHRTKRFIHVPLSAIALTRSSWPRQLDESGQRAIVADRPHQGVVATTTAVYADQTRVSTRVAGRKS